MNENKNPIQKTKDISRFIEDWIWKT
jgi:hypothetical protein